MTFARSRFERPLRGQRVGELHDLDRVERLLQDQQRIAMRRGVRTCRSTNIGVRRADHDLELRIDAPQLLDRLEPVPAGRHAHVDERERKRPTLSTRLGNELECFAPLVRGHELELALGRGLGRRHRRAEQLRLELVERASRRRTCAKDLGEVVVDRRIVVDDQDRRPGLVASGMIRSSVRRSVRAP